MAKLKRSDFPAGTRVRYTGRHLAPFDGKVLGPYHMGDYDEVMVERPKGAPIAIRISDLKRIPMSKERKKQVEAEVLAFRNRKK